MNNSQAGLSQQYGCRLVVMAKKPELGRVKTRLGRDIGRVAATRFYRHNLAQLLRRCQSEKRWQTLVAIAPDEAVYANSLVCPMPVIGQGRGGLGTRMQRLFSTLPPGPVIIIGSDIPHIQPDEIARAFHVLRQSDAILGPADDGGYWLVGLRRSPAIDRNIFQEVAWSSDKTFEHTVRNLAGKSLSLLKVMNDVDDGQDYNRWLGEGARY